MQGTVGRGKTVLSSFLVDRIPVLVSKVPPLLPVNTCYFSCDGKSNKQKDVLTIMISLLHQILVQRNELFNHIKREWEKPGQRVLQNFDALWKVFLETVQDPRAGVTFVVIDSIDECEDLTQIKYLDLFSGLVESKGGRDGVSHGLGTHTSEQMVARRTFHYGHTIHGFYTFYLTTSHASQYHTATQRNVLTPIYV